MLIDFTDTEEIPRWIAINDNVMGGISQSRIELSPTATAIFSGQLSLENNGGFTSIRRRSDNYNLNALYWRHAQSERRWPNLSIPGKNR